MVPAVVVGFVDITLAIIALTGLAFRRRWRPAPRRRAPRQPGAEVNARAYLGPRARTTWTGSTRIAPPVAGAIYDPAGRHERSLDGHPVVIDGHLEVVL